MPLSAVQIEALVEESRADTKDCPISPLWGAVNPKAVIRHMNRFCQVMGPATRGAAYGKTGLTGGGSIAFLATALLFHDGFGIILDLFFASVFGLFIGYFSIGYFAYKIAFARIFVHEHRDYIDPTQITARVGAYTARLSNFYSRAWRGDNEANAITNPQSKLFCRTEDRVEVLKQGEQRILIDGTVIDGPQLLVYPARQVIRFMEMDDYLDLPPEEFRVTGAGARNRRAVRRAYVRPGEQIERAERGRAGLISDNIPWIFAGVCVICAAFIFMMAGG